MSNVTVRRPPTLQIMMIINIFLSIGLLTVFVSGSLKSLTVMVEFVAAVVLGFVDVLEVLVELLVPDALVEPVEPVEELVEPDDKLVEELVDVVVELFSVVEVVDDGVGVSLAVVVAEVEVVVVAVGSMIGAPNTFVLTAEQSSH